MNCGGGMSFNDYLDGASRQVVELAAGLVRKKAPGVQVGLVTEPQWATVKEMRMDRIPLPPIPC